jgi:hypothetical protein
MPPGYSATPLPPKKAHRGLIIAIAAVASLVVLGAAGVAAVVLLKKPPTGEEAVRAYFDKLAAGDADGALAHVVPPTRGSYSDHPLLSDEAISDPEGRPTNLVVIERAQTSLGEGALRERVTVTYSVGDAEFRHIVRARQDKEGEPFLLEEPFFEFRVTGGEDGYSINGVPFEYEPSMPPFAFPGVYSGSVEGNALYAEVTVEADGGEDRELPAILRLEFESELAAGAEEAVQAAVNAYLDACVQDHAMIPATPDQKRCPFGVRGDEVLSVNWSIGRYPDIMIDPMGDDRKMVFVTTQATGLVRYDLPPGWVDDEMEFEFAGTAGIAGETVVVNILLR